MEAETARIYSPKEILWLALDGRGIPVRGRVPGACDGHSLSRPSLAAPCVLVAATQ